MSELNEIRQECWTQAVHAFGTYYVFENRANRLRRRLRLLTFLGIALPVLVGVAFSTYGASSWFTTFAVVITSALSVVLALASVFSLVFKRDDGYAYASESMSANRALFDKYRRLGGNPPALEEAKIQFALVHVEAESRATADEKQGFTDNEKRMGMCAALRQLKKPCATCKSAPTSMTPSNCDTCGNFKIPRI